MTPAAPKTVSAPEATRCPATVAYRAEGSRSARLYEQARRVMPGGNTRHSVALTPHPIFAAAARGCRITDVEGESRIDFLNNYTSAILGHADPEVMDAVSEQLGRGASFSMPTQTDLELAELLVDRVPYIEQVRFCNSGSEAVMLAIKAARAFTGRTKIAKFEGTYHGIYDYAQVSELPTPGAAGPAEEPASIVESSAAASVREDVVILPWNRPEICERLIEKHKASLAAVLMDPLPSSVGLIAPREGFIESLREMTRKAGVLLICDEVLTFRISYHGATHEFGIRPDLATFGKVIGGGFPVGAVAGTAEVMAVFDHTLGMKVHHGGTFNANPVTMTAGLATLRKLTPEVYDRLNALGERLRDSLRQRFAARGVTAQVTGKGSLFMTHFTDAELIDVRSHKFAPGERPDPNRLTHEMLGRGIVVAPSSTFGCLSTPMGEGELEAYVNAMEESLAAMGFGAS